MGFRWMAALSVASLLGAAPVREPAIDVRIVTDEAEAALTILKKRQAGRNVQDADWQRLFRSEGYRRLKQREEAMGNAFDDASFRAFLLSDTLVARTDALAKTLDQWRRMNPATAAQQALGYLPLGARIRAKTYLVIKPRTNSFVFDTQRDPAVFVYVDPQVTAPNLENTVVHELHHIGYSAACAPGRDSTLPAGARTARLWLGAFGEGIAMLAAAGSADTHPHATSPDADRARWDRDVANAPADLGRVQSFVGDVASGRLVAEDSVRTTAMSFFGEQGPWYTVGWVMASTIEKTFGRPRLIGSMCDPAQLLATYNAAAKQQNEGGAKLPLWSDDLLTTLGAGQPSR